MGTQPANLTGYQYPPRGWCHDTDGPKDDRVLGSQSVYRAIAVLKGVARDNATGMTASVLADTLDLTMATTHRLLKTLASEGLLTFDPYSKKYHLGFELYMLGVEARYFGLSDLLAGPMERIRTASHETVLLLVRSGTDALCLQRLDGVFPLRALTLTVGSRRPLGVGAGGIALLAFEPDEVIELVLRHNEKIYPHYADLTLAQIRAEAAAARKRGFSFNDGRLRDDIRAVGLAVGPDGEAPIAAVSIATSQSRITKSQQSDMEKLLKSELGDVDWRLLESQSKRPNL